MYRFFLVVGLFLACSASAAAERQVPLVDPSSASEAANGFVLEGALLPPEKIIRGMERDGVRSVDTPEFADLEEARQWVAPGTVVLGLSVGNQSRAYPEHLLDFHQVVNDELGGVPIVVVWDPIAGLPMAFERILGERTLEFGVAGLLYESHCLIYDRETESLWLPQQGRAISGPLAGQKLKRLALRKEPLKKWISEHPETRILKRPLRKKIDYRYSPFSAHWASSEIPFPVDHVDARYHPKDLVLGIEYPGGSKAYLGSRLSEAGGRIVDEIDGKTVRVSYDPDTVSFSWVVPPGVSPYESYWFAWKTLHPETRVWQGAEPLRLPARR